MAFTQEELETWEGQVKSFIEKRRPLEHIRSELDLDYSIQDQSIEIFEIRPKWDDPTRKVQSPVAKTTWVRNQQIWKIYWMRADLKWHLYDPDPKVDKLEEFLHIINADPYSCFWG